MATHEESTAAQLRGDIDRGRAGDRAPATDPAAAPMETDAEAGGAAPSSMEIAMERDAIAAAPSDRGANEASPDRTPDGAAKGTQLKPFLRALGALSVCIIIVFAAVAWLL